MNLKSVYYSKRFRSAAAFFLLTGLLLPVFASARADDSDTASDLMSACTITLPEDSVNYVARLTDNRYNSRISFSKTETLEISLPNGAKGLYVAWYEAPVAARIEALDASGEVMTTAEANSDLLNDYYAIPEGCATLRIAGDRAFAISELRVYDRETAPGELCIMTAQETQPKVMVILAHTGDEAYDFGSLLPFISGGDAALVFLSSESRQAQQQAIEVRYALGSRTQPIFADFQYYKTTLSLKNMYGIIDKTEISTYLVRLLRRYQPAALITHSAEGERADGMALLTATHVLLAAEQAADASVEYVSEREYGVWQVGTVYQHMESGNYPIYDSNSGIVAFGGKTAVELAQTAFDHYPSFWLFHTTVSDTPYFMQTYPVDVAVSEAESAKNLYALLASLSGPVSLPDAAVTPEPADTPEPEATSDTAVSTTETEQTAEPILANENNKTIFYVGLGLAALGVIVVVLSFAAHFNGTESKPKTIRIVGITVGVLLAVCGAVLTLRANKAMESPEPTPTPTPTPQATATASSPAETTTPTPDEDAFASHFRQAGDPEEVVVFDYENGIYEYHSDTLGIEIRRVTRTDPPVVYYVANIYERDEDSYRSGFGSERQNGRDPEDACTMARRYSAVLGITGDNLLHSDYNRGLMIRDGRVFRAMTQQSVMALTDDFSMRIYFANDQSMLSEIEDGTRDTYAFGPPLIIDGAICENVDEDRVGRINPRAGLGLVEPGHFVAIVVDGRLPRYSHGVLLSDFAQMFLDEGCVMAYNLDGGASASMVFMGEYLNHRSENHYRSVPDQLFWGYSELVPGVDDTRVYSGLVAQDWAGD